jgi:hypothetical protein
MVPGNCLDFIGLRSMGAVLEGDFDDLRHDFSITAAALGAVLLEKFKLQMQVVCRLAREAAEVRSSSGAVTQIAGGYVARHNGVAGNPRPQLSSPVGTWRP